MTEQPGRKARAALALTDWSERWLPDAFIFALLATVLVIVAALAATPATPLQVVDAWGRGFWELIPFTLQMALIIITGHVLATSPPIGRVIRFLASLPRSPRGAVALVTFAQNDGDAFLRGFSLVFGAVLAIGGIWYTNRLGAERKVLRALASSDARPHVSATGQMAVVNLDDGTRATLTPESKLIVPKNFGPQLRAVRVEGTARLAVASGGERPFQAYARQASLTAVGTDFIVKLFAVDSTVVAVVREGQVVVNVGDSTRTLSANGAVAVTPDGRLRDATPGEVEETGSWADGKLAIVDRSLRDALPEMRRWYGLDLKVVDLPLLDRKVTVRAPLDSPMEGIKALEASGQLKFGYEGKTMVLNDGAKKK